MAAAPPTPRAFPAASAALLAAPVSVFAASTALLAALVALLAMPAAAGALGWATTAAHAAEPSSVSGEASAQEGAVSTILTYREGLGGPLPYYDLRLTIARSGAVFYDQPVNSHFCLSGCEPATLAIEPPPKISPVAVVDLEGNGQSSVVLELSTGGAHCCAVVQVFSFDPGTMTYGIAEHDFGDPGALLTTLAGNPRPVFESGDDRFAYEFAPYAGSAFPLEVLDFQDGRFLNVTRSFPKQIAAQATSLFKGFQVSARHGEGLGVIAAWAADEDELGHRALVTSVLAREQRHGELRSRERYGPAGAAFVRALGRFLKRTGYS